MRFGDVQDTRKNETKENRRDSLKLCFEKQMQKLSELNRSRKMATAFGITFTI